MLFIISWTLPDVLSHGDRVFYFDARSLALGGAANLLENSYNPAGAGLVTENIIIFSGVIVTTAEKRGLRVYDSYGNNMGISTIANNRATHPNLGPGVVLFPLRFLRAGVKYHTLWDFNYFYRYEYRNDFYQITRIVEDRYSGNSTAISPMLCLNYNFINIGFEQSFLMGQKSKEFRVMNTQAADSIEERRADYDGSKMKFGFLITPGYHFRMCYTYSSSYKLQTPSGLNLSYPANHTVGFLYSPAGRVPTKFVCEIENEQWTEPIFSYKFGVEHTVVYRYAMRYGFCIYPAYTEPAIWTTVLTLGFGLHTDQYYFDLGFGYAKRDYAGSDFDGLDAPQNYLFDESVTHFLFTAGIEF